MSDNPHNKLTTQAQKYLQTFESYSCWVNSVQLYIFKYAYGKI